MGEAAFKEYCRRYIRYKGWNVQPEGIPLHWRAEKEKTRFCVICDARLSPIRITTARDLSEIRRRFSIIMVLNGKLSDTEWHLLDKHEIKSIHYTELGEFCDRMLAGTAYDLPAPSPGVETVVASPDQVIADADHLPLSDGPHVAFPEMALPALEMADAGVVLERPASTERPSPPRALTWRRIAISEDLLSTSPLACPTEENVYATPFKIFSQGGDGFDPAVSRHKNTRFHIAGAAYRQEDGMLIEESRRPGGTGGDIVESIDPGRIIIPAARGEVRFPGTTLYLGNYMNYQEHFTTEFLSKLWCVDEIKFDQIVVRPFIFQNGSVVLFPFADELLSAVLPSDSQIKVVTDGAFFERAVIPAQAWPVNSKCNVAVRSVYAKIRAHYSVGEATGRIFLTRNQNAYKGIANMAEIEHVAADLGFTIVNPESLPIADQMRLYANSQVIAGFEGMSLRHCVFSRPGTTVIDMGDVHARHRPHHVQLAVQAISEVDMYHIPYEGTDDGICNSESVRAELAAILDQLVI